MFSSILSPSQNHAHGPNGRHRASLRSDAVPQPAGFDRGPVRPAASSHGQRRHSGRGAGRYNETWHRYIPRSGTEL